ncbi:hypothetical protein DQ384_00495 [Sphaerisporangium album]|uniref:Uncharacterized protein n=1 Tax=Sphaerisporangium album TaxID=509200 RepID=A0A367FSR9_9ACTN|nr:hypothetical protein [Sphaerisporangium album]RCG32969.1 hypothetical protein DQ384_00495 [Sphaerisporangium album]
MIYLSAILVVLAFGLLVAGVVTGTAVLVMWSIVVSVLSAVFLMIGALLRRHELFPSGGVPAATPPMSPAGAGVAGGLMAHPGAVASPMAPPRGASSPVVRPMAAPHLTHPAATHVAHPGSASPSPRTFPATVPVGVPAVAGAGGGLAPDAIVLVVPGRKRFHLSGCRQLAGRETEELTYEEAREEGFSACTTCFPEGAKASSAETGAHPALGQAPRTTGQIPRATPGQTSQPALEQAADPLPGQSLGSPSDQAALPGLAARRAPGATPAATTQSRSPAEPRSTSRPDRPQAAGGPSREDRPGTAPKPEPGGYRSDETRPVPSLPASALRPGTGKDAATSGGPGDPAPADEEKTDGPARKPTDGPARKSGERPASTPEPKSLASDPKSAASASEPKSAASASEPRSAASASEPKSPASSAAPKAAQPLISFKAPEVPEASTPFQAFKRPEGSTPTSPRPTGDSRRPSDAPKAPVGDEAPKKPTRDDEDDDPVVVVAATSTPAPRKPATPGTGAETGSDAKPTAPGAVGGETKSGARPAPRPAADESKEAAGKTAGKETTAHAGDAEDSGDSGEEKAGPSGGEARSRTVKVIPGTRRYHSSACPLIKGSDPDTLDTLSQSEAEAKGLTHCAVCENS